MNGPREGDLFKTLLIEGTAFEIRYGYYSDAERERWKPIPIYPDFSRNPQYTASGWPFVTAEKDVCPHYQPRPKVSGENWCNDCIYYTPGAEIIGICKCKARRKSTA